MNVIVYGASGRMGQNLMKVIGEHPEHRVAAAVSPELTTCPEEQTYRCLTDFTGLADMIVDFSHHTAVGELLDYAQSRKLPVVIGTTGHTPEERARIALAAKEIPVFQSGNMSVGIALLMELARQTAAMFPDADIEIVEAHHNRKLDVPSGTALMLYKTVQEARPEAIPLVGRHENGKRTKAEVGIHSLRMGNTVGWHEVIVNTGTQIITLKHEAQDRALFAEGALAAAQFLIGKDAGMYNMNHIVK